MSDWISVCALNDIAPDTGICALHQGQQVAIYRLGASEQVFALSNYDPFGKANVMSRGILGSVGEQRVVSSPLYKQHFDLHTGVCLQDGEVALDTFAVRINKGNIELASLDIANRDIENQDMANRDTASRDVVNPNVASAGVDLTQAANSSDSTSAIS